MTIGLCQPTHEIVKCRGPVTAFNTDPVGLTQTTYTQTYSDASATVAAATTSAITDSSTGTPAATIAAGAGCTTLVIPCTLPAGTSAGDVITNYVLGYKFKILAWSYTTAVAGVGAGASRVFNMEIGTTDVGTVVSTCTLTEASTSDIGEQTAGTAVSGANTGASNATFSIEVANGGTAFTAGSGFFTVQIQNMDTADAIATLAAQAELAKADILARTQNINKLIDDLQKFGTAL